MSEKKEATTRSAISTCASCAFCGSFFLISLVRNVLRHQPQLFDTCGLGGIDQLRNVVEQQVVVGLQEDSAVAPASEDVLKTPDQLHAFDFVLIDLDDTVSIHAQHNCGVLRLSVRTRRRRLRYFGFQSQRLDRADRHENHEQHQQDIDEQRHVDVRSRQYSPAFLLHGSSSTLYLWLKTPESADLFPISQTRSRSIPARATSL